jgi:hypothetical protein
LLSSGFSRDEVKLIKRSDFEAQPAPETDILKLGGVPPERAGQYWDAVRGGRTLIIVSAGDRTGRAIQIMDAEGALYLEETISESTARAVAPVVLSTDPGFYAHGKAAQLFEVS